MPTVEDELDRLQVEVDTLLERLTDAERRWQSWIEPTAPEHRCSAVNLVHYLALRQTDLRDMQQRLAAFGLSSLGRSEAHVQSTLRRVSAAIAAMRGRGWTPTDHVAVDIEDGARLLDRNATAVLGPAAPDRAARVMVTLPSEAAVDSELVRELVSAGMRLARINCAHDDPAAWAAMAAHVRAAGPCLVAMDLSGPKLRTGPLQPGPRVVRLRPSRDALGRVRAPAKAWLTAAAAPTEAPEAGLVVLPVGDPGWLSRRRDGQELVLRDTRGSRRRLVISASDRGGCLVTAHKTTYLGTGTVLEVSDGTDATAIGDLPPTEQSLRLSAGDLLQLTRDCSPAPVCEHQRPRIGCTLPELFDTAERGDRILFDDGRLAGRIVAIGEGHLDVRIDRPRRGEAKLRAGKGINVPDTDLPIPALTDKDVSDLATVVQVADLVELSFVREPADVIRLLAELERLGARDLGVVLKIETRQAFEQLPQLILTAMRHRRVGIMIARGDLAVESGYERMAELQEETLWLCEAAHLPVIWATQVLEQLAKTGLPSRAEITDAAMGERAECVMLNKGPYIVDAVIALDDILSRMAGHEYKKSALLRSLHTWHGAGPASTPRTCS